MANIFKNFDDENKGKGNPVKNDKSAKNDKSKKVTNDNYDKNVKDIANNEQFNQFKEKYKDKSEDDILKDAKEYSQKLKEQYGDAEYKKKIEDLKKFEMFLSPEQKKKMKKFLDSMK